VTNLPLRRKFRFVRVGIRQAVEEQESFELALAIMRYRARDSQQMTFGKVFKKIIREDTNWIRPIFLQLQHELSFLGLALLNTEGLIQKFGNYSFSEELLNAKIRKHLLNPDNYECLLPEQVLKVRTPLYFMQIEDSYQQAKAIHNFSKKVDQPVKIGDHFDGVKIDGSKLQDFSRRQEVVNYFEGLLGHREMGTVTGFQEIIKLVDLP